MSNSQRIYCVQHEGPIQAVCLSWGHPWSAHHHDRQTLRRLHRLRLRQHL